MEITKTQIKAIHYFLPAEIKGDKDAKANLVSQFTDNIELTSTKDLSFNQAKDLIHFLRTGEVPNLLHFAYFDKDNKQHLYLLSLCIQMGWYKMKRGKPIADLERFGGWLQKSGFLHKPLKRYPAKELTKLVYQFEQVVKGSL